MSSTYSLKLQAMTDQELAHECLMALRACLPKASRAAERRADLCAIECTDRKRGDIWADAVARVKSERHPPQPEEPTVTQTATKTPQTQLPDVEQPAKPLAVIPEPPVALLAAALTVRPNLAKALVAAISAVKPVPHDARNDYHKYKYTSSEAIIEEAKGVLAPNGLAVIPIEQTVNGSDREGPDRFELVSKRLLLHVSGESILCVSAWPIVPEKGRPLDKATAAADTLSLAYFLRDLLQMPRVDPDAEVAARDDRQQQRPQAATREQAPAPQKPTPRDQESQAPTPRPNVGHPDHKSPQTVQELKQRLRQKDSELARQGLCKQGELVAYLERSGAANGWGGDVEKWSLSNMDIIKEMVKQFEADARARRGAA